MDAGTQINGQRYSFGISQKLLVLTISFVLLAEVLIYVPSIAQFRNNWLGDRLAAARIAALVIEAAPPQSMPEATIQEMLKLLDAKTITIKMGGSRRLLAFNNMPPMIDQQFDLRNSSVLTSIMESFDTLLTSKARTLNIIGPAPMGGDFIDIVIDETPLRKAMLEYSINIVIVSLAICTITTALLYFALCRIVLNPLSRIISNINGFTKNLENPNASIKPITKSDELGQAEHALYEMQTVISTRFKEKQRLTALGLAVSKINHDLRNMLSSVQLFSDRLTSLPDPTVQRLAPKLVAALDRAIHFCESTLSFGKASEAAPKPQHVKLASIISDMRETLEDKTITWHLNIPHGFKVYVDQDQLFRALVNLGRNSVQALKHIDKPCISITAQFQNNASWIDVLDNGAGISKQIKPKLFQAFNGSNKVGSTGLGLSIASELMKANSGTLELLETKTGTGFRITLPNNPTEPSCHPYQSS